MNQQYQKITLPKAVVYLTQQEVHHLLLQDIELYKTVLARGKAFSRSAQHKNQSEKKWAEHESQALNKFLQ